MTHNPEIKIVVTGDHGLIIINGRKVRLTKTQRAIIKKLAENPNKTVRKDDLYIAMYSEKKVRPGYKNIDVQIHRIRQKMEGVCRGSSVRLHTHAGQGYILYLDRIPDELPKREGNTGILRRIERIQYSEE